MVISVPLERVDGPYCRNRPSCELRIPNREITSIISRKSDRTQYSGDQMDLRTREMTESRLEIPLPIFSRMRIRAGSSNRSKRGFPHVPPVGLSPRKACYSRNSVAHQETTENRLGSNVQRQQSAKRRPGKRVPNDRCPFRAPT